MSVLIGTCIALVASILGGIAALFFERRKSASPKATKAAGKHLVEQAEELARSKVQNAIEAGKEKQAKAQEKAVHDAKAEAAAGRLRDYLATRRKRSS